MSDISVGDPQVPIVPVRSRRFLCGVCGERLTEMQTMFKKQFGPNFYEKQKELRKQGKKAATTKVKLRCPRGCHRAPWFTICDVTMPSKKFRP